MTIETRITKIGLPVLRQETYDSFMAQVKDIGTYEDQIKFLEALFQILYLLWAHDSRVFIVRDELGDHALLCMPLEFGHMFLTTYVNKTRKPTSW